MIEPQQATQSLLDACPSFAERWDEHQQDHGEALLYVAAGSFAAHLLRLYRDSQTETFPAVAAAVEGLHVEGSPWVKEFATVGILEAIQNVWANSGADPAIFRAYLGEESRKWWSSLNDFWAGRTPLVRPQP
jgi:hypothetical protein